MDCEEYSVPPRWLLCPRKSAIIDNRFLVFKAPLDEKYDHLFTEEHKFDLHMIFGLGLNLGMIVDLTNSSRFYNSDVVKEGYNCQYLKLSCTNTDEVPTKEECIQFFKSCDRFIRNNPNFLIGVHSTHGFNRSGFLIAGYLVYVRHLSAQQALSVFASARPPGIFKQDYLSEFYKRWGGQNEVPTPPSSPSWYMESEKADATQYVMQNMVSCYEPFIKEGLFMDGLVSGVNAVKDVEEMKRIKEKIGKMCEWDNEEFPGTRPVNMTRSNLLLLTEQPYKVSWKADGTRYMMLIEGQNNVYMVNKNNTVFKLEVMTFPRRKEPTNHLTDTLIDGEMVFDNVNNIQIPRYLICDIIKFEGQAVGRMNFDIRLQCIEKEIITPRNNMIIDGSLNKNLEPFSVRAKPFWDVSCSRKLLDGNFSKTISHKIEGLIFQPINKVYKTGKCIEMLTWNPTTFDSVNFKIISGLSTDEDYPELVANLYVEGCDKPYTTIPLTVDIQNSNGKIIECRWNCQYKQWVFVRPRPDKTVPSSLETVKSVVSAIKEPVSKNMLYHVIDRFRFGIPDKDRGQGNPLEFREVKQESRCKRGIDKVENDEGCTRAKMSRK